MKDKRIINIISKIYLIIGSFLSFILLSLITIFIILQNGLYLDNLSISNITVKNLYIKWDNKLNLYIDEIDVQRSKETVSTTKINISDINKYIAYTSRFFLLTENVVIEKLLYDDMAITFKHSADTNGLITVQSSSFKLNSKFKFQDNLLICRLNKYDDLKNKVKVDGKIILNTFKEELYSKLHILVNNNTNFLLFAKADNECIKYSIKTTKDIVHIKQLIHMFHLPKELDLWTVDAIDAKSLTIDKIKGCFKYNDPASAYRNVHVLATLNKLNYTYNPKLDAIHTKRTELEFLDGVLYIRPKEAYSYGMYLDRSWLKIDFTKKDELLTLYLLFNGMLNKDMLHILNTYNIKLPFLQHSGKVKTDLKITVNLRSIKVNAKGTFITKKANFDYIGLNIDIKDTVIELHNYDIKIPQMKAKYKNIAQADVTVEYNAKKALGSINFKFNKIKLNQKYHLSTTNGPLKAIYKISPKGDTIIANKSYWSLENFDVVLDKLTLPFNLDKLKVTIPTTFFTVKNIASGYVTGDANLKKSTLMLKLDLLKFKYNGIKATQSNTQFRIKYNKKLTITSQNNIFFTINGSPYKVEKLQIKSDFKTLSLQNAKLFVGKYITTDIQGKYIFKNKKANISLHNFLLKDPQNKTILYYNHKINLNMKTEKKTIHIRSQKLFADFMILGDKWVLNLNDIGVISKNSKLLKQYALTNGKVSFYKNENNKYTKFKADINYKYKLLTDLNRPIGHYHITGYITKKQNIYLTINKNLHIKIAKNIKINLKDSGLNASELQKFIKVLSNKKSKKKNRDLNILFNAVNSYIYLGYNRYIISDTIDLQYYNNITTAQLQYKNAKAGFKLQNNKFHLYGQNFNDYFMENLFSLSKFKGGHLDFSIDGTLDEYDGTFFIKNTTIKDYVVLNNILAFINTVPSLATFSLPGYNKNGLHVDNAYMKFHYKDHIFHVSDIYIGSKEIKIFGEGETSIKYNTIDLTLNLKTDIGSKLSKIPVVGYLIFDGQSLSTTLKISGQLTDPKVTTMLAKDMVVAPLNIIQRTLTLPYKLFKDISTNINSLEKE